MTAHELFNLLSDRKSRGVLHCQPADLQTVIVTTAGGYVSRKSLGTGADVITRGGRLSDASEIFRECGFAGVPSWMEGTDARA